MKTVMIDDAGTAKTIAYKGRTITYRWRSHTADQWEGWQRKTPEGWVAIHDKELIKALEK